METPQTSHITHKRTWSKPPRQNFDRATKSVSSRRKSLYNVVVPWRLPTLQRQRLSTTKHMRTSVVASAYQQYSVTFILADDVEIEADLAVVAATP
jgi:hypothetical protein